MSQIATVKLPTEHPEMLGDYVIEHLLGHCDVAVAAAEHLADNAKEVMRGKVAPTGQIDGDLLEEEQFAAHGYAWIATYVEALRQMRAWAGRLNDTGLFGEQEALILQSAFGEYLNLGVVFPSARGRLCGRRM